MTLKGGTSQACAACKYQRRKCTSECVLAPYFPADQPKTFQNVHRLFGVSNIAKILRQVDASHKAEAMQSIIWQANFREMFPVDGCCWVIRQLFFLIHQHEEELHATRVQLAVCRQQTEASANGIEPADPDSQLQLAPVSGPVSLPHFQQGTPQCYSNGMALGMGNLVHGNSDITFDPAIAYLDTKDNVINATPWSYYNGSPIASSNNGMNDIKNPMTLETQLMTPQSLNAQHEQAQDYDEISPYFDTIDDRQSYIDSKEGNESSSEELKDTTQSLERTADHELKSAAARLSLTSLN